MAALPSYVSLLYAGQTDSFDPGIVKSEMERGLAKHRVQSSRVLRKLSVTLQFQTRADVNAFEVWYFDTIGRIGFFDVVHPRTGQTIAMRFESASIGDLVPASSGYHIATRAAVLEYLQ